MPDNDRALSLAERVLKATAGADQAQVSVQVTDAAYARFARNYVTQNLAARSTQITIDYYIGKQSGAATTDDPTDASIARAVEVARQTAKRTPADPDFVSLPKARPISTAANGYFAATAEATPDDRVEKLLPVFARMKRSNLSCAGYTQTQTQTLAVANSLGVRAAYTGTIGGIELKAMAPRTSGWAEYFHPDYATFDPVPVAEIAAGKATVSAEPADLAPGSYTVILEANPFADALSAILEGVSAFAVIDEKVSWMAGRTGQTLFSANFTLRDDWQHPLFANPPFNPNDGSPTERITLVDRGVAKAFVSDTYEANKLKIANTGHPGYPVNAVIEPGTRSREELIASTERGVLVSRTWYSRVVDPRTAQITGLTRDGVYLIENGKLTKALKNFRYFVSMLDALKDVEFSNKQQLTAPGETMQRVVAPDAKFTRFTFSAQTSYA
jgi:PmbA protein